MPDVVVTVPKNFAYGNLVGLAAWISEGDAAGDEWSGVQWHFTLGGTPPRITEGERVYIVCEGKLRGYAPLVRIDRFEDEDDLSEFGDLEYNPPQRKIGGYALVRKGGAVAVTIDEPIRGFQGFRYRWWKYEDEYSFPEWKTP